MGFLSARGWCALAAAVIAIGAAPASAGAQAEPSDRMKRELQLLNQRLHERAPSAVPAASPSPAPAASAVMCRDLENRLEQVRRGAPAEVAEARRALAECGSPAVPGLLDLVDDREDEVRVAALQALAEIADRRAVERIVPRLRDGSWQVRVAAAQALGRTRNAAGLEGLLAELGDPLPNVDEAMLTAIQAFGSGALPGLLPILDDRSERRRRDAAIAIGTIADPAAQAALLAAYDREPLWWVRQQIVDALGKLRDPSSTGFFVKAMADPGSGVRAAAASVLGEIGGSEAVADLVEALKDT